MVPDTVLIVAEDFPRLAAHAVARALAQGLEEGPEQGLGDGPGDGAAFHPAEVLTVEQGLGAREWWNTTEHATKLRAARAVVIAAARLDEHTLTGSMAFEVATSARQTGVPAYAVTAANDLDLFDARMLDLQAILRASAPGSLRSAGGKLAQLI